MCCLKQSDMSVVEQGMSAMTPQCLRTENYVWVTDHVNDKELLNCRASGSHLNMPKGREHINRYIVHINMNSYAQVVQETETYNLAQNILMFLPQAATFLVQITHQNIWLQGQLWDLLMQAQMYTYGDQLIENMAQLFFSFMRKEEL